MSVRGNTTVCLNKTNTAALRALVKPGETVNALANRLLAEKLKEDVEKAEKARAEEAARIALELMGHTAIPDGTRKTQVLHAPIQETLLKLPVEKLGLTPAAMMVLAYRKITTIGELTEATEKDLRKAPLCLNSAIANIKTQLLRYGLKLKED